MIRTAAGAFAVRSTGRHANAIAYMVRIEESLQYSRRHHLSAFGADPHLYISSVNGGFSTAAGVNPDTGWLLISLRVNAKISH